MAATTREISDFVSISCLPLCRVVIIGADLVLFSNRKPASGIAGKSQTMRTIQAADDLDNFIGSAVTIAVRKSNYPSPGKVYLPAWYPAHQK